jgi:hypothetical protein
MTRRILPESWGGVIIVGSNPEVSWPTSGSIRSEEIKFLDLSLAIGPKPNYALSSLLCFNFEFRPEPSFLSKVTPSQS